MSRFGFCFWEILPGTIFKFVDPSLFKTTLSSMKTIPSQDDLYRKLMDLKMAPGNPNASLVTDLSDDSGQKSKRGEG